MRTAQLRKANRTQVAGVKSYPAPVGGWNARDAINQMKPIDAFRLVNWWPTASELEVRLGSSLHVGGLISQVESLLVYRPESGAEKLFACSNNWIVEVTGASIPGTVVQSGLSSNRWQSVNFSTAGGNFLLAVNGLDDMRLFDGAAWTAVNAGSTPAITGVATSSWSKLALFKERVFALEKDSLRAWYLPVKSIAGTAALVDLRSVFRRGGSLTGLVNWSVDGGSGPDDYLLFITSQGEVAMYKGTDPSNSATWSLVGIYSIAPPLGPTAKYGGDVLILTREGLVPASKALLTSETDPGIALTNKILTPWLEAAQLFGGNYGWDVIHFPHASMLLINVPVALNRQVQYAMNTQTGAWTQFSGWPANTFAIFQGGLYFGGFQAVKRAWTGLSDDGAAIQADAITSFDAFGAPAQIKDWRMVRPTVASSSSAPDIRVGMCVDFKIRTPEGAVQIAGLQGALWNISLWDQAVWGGAPEVQNGRYSVDGIGYHGALALSARTKDARVKWSAVTYLYETGGVL